MKPTEKVIVEAFGELLEEKPLNKITVRDIVERCGINRNTFYYHFQDIPGLLEQLLKDKADWMIQNNAKPGSVTDCLSLLVGYVQRHKKAALHIYQSLSRETFVDNLETVASYTVTEYVDQFIQQLGYQVREQDKAYLIRYYKCTFVGVILDWMDAELNYDLCAVVDRVCVLMEGSAVKAFARSAGIEQ